MAGFFGKQLQMIKRHPDVIPLLVIVPTVTSLAVAFGIRTALKNPDVSWDRHANPEPWNKIKQNQQTKLLNIHQDYSTRKFDDKRPCMDNDRYKGI